MNSPVNKIKERLSIEEVVSSYITLEKKGSNLKAKCPFHNEKTPSFFISPDRGTYYCFGCGASGDIFTFVEEFEGLDFKGALKLLAERAGVILSSFNKEEEGEKERLYKVVEEATKYFENNLKENLEVVEYLKSRGLTDKTIADFRLGFALNDWRALYFYLKKKNYSDKDIELAGLAKKSEKSLSAGGQSMYDRFRSRIIFPILDSSGRVIAFSGRIYGTEEPSASREQVISQAKYLNSPETPIFNKSSILYGIDKAKESIRKNNFSILVEGQMDLILSHQSGWKNTIATSGTALSDATISKENAVSNLGLIRRLSNNIVLGFDGDKAGINATNRAGKIALLLGMDVKVADLPEGLDPADLISQKGNTAWKDAIKNSKHLIEFILNKILNKKDKDIRKIGRDIREQLLPYINDISSSIEKSFFIKKISDATGIPLHALQEDLENLEKEFKYEKKEIEEIDKSRSGMFRKDYILRKLFGIILWQETLKESTLDTVSLRENIKNDLGIEIEQFLKDTMNNKEDLIFEAEVFYNIDKSLVQEAEELFRNLKEEYLKEELAKKMRALSKAEEEKDKEKSNQILKECQDIINKIENLKNSRLTK